MIIRKELLAGVFMSFCLVWQAGAFNVGDRVQCTTTILNIRSSPSTNAGILGQANTGDRGTVGGGPYSGSGYTWYYVSWDTHPAGYSIQDYLALVANQPPTHGIASQVRADTGAVMADPNGTVPYGVGVYFRVTPTDPDGDTARMEVELHQLPATFTGSPNYVSSYVSSGSVATTATATGLAAGNYGWRYRVVDSHGNAGSWVSENNPDFIVQAANQPPTHGIASQVRADTGAVMADPNGTVPYGVGVYFRVTPTDPDGDTARMEVELHQLPATFTGSPNYVSSYVSSGSVATTATATGLAAGNYGWRYRVVDSHGNAGAWVSENNPDFIVQATGGCLYSDDYPYPTGNVFNPANPSDLSTIDPWAFYNRECTSYCAWKLNKAARTTSSPYFFSNRMLGGHFGDAGGWATNATAIGFVTNNIPAVGAIAHWGYGELGVLGHVAYVEAVNG